MSRLGRNDVSPFRHCFKQCLKPPKKGTSPPALDFRGGTVSRVSRVRIFLRGAVAACVLRRCGLDKLNLYSILL